MGVAASNGARRNLPGSPEAAGAIIGKKLSDKFTNRNNDSEGRKPRFLNERTGVRLKRTRWKPMDWMFGTQIGQIFLLLVAAVLLNLGGTLGWMGTGGNAESDGGYDTSFWQSTWFAWGVFFDPGTQMSFVADEPLVIKATAALFSVLGFIHNLLMLGLFVELSRNQLDYWRKKRHCIVANGHILLLGWTSKTLFVLEQIISAGTNRGEKANIVILADQDVMFMQSEVQKHFPNARDQKMITCRQGQPFECNDLVKASVKSAREVILLSNLGDGQCADLASIRNVLALASLPDRPSGNVIVEVQQPQSSSVISAVLPLAEGIFAKDAINRVMWLMAVKPITGDILQTFMSWTHNEELYCKLMKDLGPRFASCQTFGEICQRFDTGVCIGVKPINKEPVYGPPDDYRIGSSDKLMVVADSELSLVRQGVREVPSTESTLHAIRSSVELLELGRGLPPEDGRKSASSGRRVANDAEVNRDGLSLMNTKTLIVIGWPNDAAAMFRCLDEYVEKGSLLHIHADTRLDDRERLLKERRLDARIQNLRIEQTEGPMTDAWVLAALPLEAADAILVVADHALAEDATSSDAACLACAVTIDGLLDRRFPDIFEGSNQHCRLMCEMNSPVMERALIESSLKSRITFFQSYALETGLFAMASAETSVYNALQMLLQPAMAGNLAAVAVEEFMAPEELLPGQTFVTFWDLWARVRAKEEVLLGWKKSGSNESTINPGNRRSPLTLEEGDVLILVIKSTLAATPMMPPTPHAVITKSFQSTKSTLVDQRAPSERMNCPHLVDLS